MDIIINKCTLFLFGMLSLLLTNYGYSFVVACFGSVILSGFASAFPDKKNHCLMQIPALLFACLTFVIQEFCFFLPLLLYDFLPEHWLNFCSDNYNSFSPKTSIFQSWNQKLLSTVIYLLSILGIFYSCRGNATLLFPLFGCLLAFMLRLRTHTYHALYHKYRKTRDDDTELQILLKERNQTLLEKQDSEIYAATLRERNRIAREIHDNVGHMLTRAILMVGALRTIQKEGPMAEPLNQLNDTLNQAMNNIRQSVHDLHDSSVNLKESLETLIREFTFCPVKLHYEMSQELPREIKYSFISIAKEALVNISKHSNATAASITALEHPGFYQFIIEDNGTPSDSWSSLQNSISKINSDQSDSGSGIGLINMENRVKALQGNMQIREEKGFCIHITIPKK